MLQIGNGGTTGSLGVSTAPLTDSGTLTINLSNAFNLGIILQGSGALLQAGSGTTSLSAANTFTGGVTINAGTLRVANAGALNAAQPSLVAFGSNSTGALQLAGTNISVAGLNTAATVGSPSVQNGSSTPATLTIVGSGQYNFGGALQDGTGGGSLSLVMAGSGSQTLSGVSNFSGGVTLEGGSLIVAGPNGALASTTPVNFAATSTFAYQGGPSGSSLPLGTLAITAGDATIQSIYCGGGVTPLAFSVLTAVPAGSTRTVLVSGGVNGVTNKVALPGFSSNSFVDVSTFFSTGNGGTYGWYDAAGYLRGINYGSDPGSATTAGATSIAADYLQTTGAVTAESTTTRGMTSC